jgi:hypothetical protein
MVLLAPADLPKNKIQKERQKGVERSRRINVVNRKNSADESNSDFGGARGRRPEGT